MNNLFDHSPGASLFTKLVVLILLTPGLQSLWAQSHLVFEEKDGLVAVEAEHYNSQKKTEIRSWQLRRDCDPDSNFANTASGKAYMELLPDTRKTHNDLLVHGNNFAKVPGLMAIMEYQVYFNTPGRYYVWARCYSTGSEDNGIHVGINGIWPESGQRMQWCDGKRSWRWENAQRTEKVHCGVPGMIFLDIPTPGIHTIAFSMREDGFRLDKWLMTTDPQFAHPEDEGPEEKVFSGQTQTNTSTGSYHFPAFSAFKIIHQGAATYYLDKKNKALAINASNKLIRGQFAQALLPFQGTSGYYDLTLHTLAESDGECTYRLLVNGKLIGSSINQSTNKDSDYKPGKVMYRCIPLDATDTIVVESNTHTNGLIPEGEETAWARGRWTALDITPACQTRSIVREFPGRVAWSADGNQHDTDDWLASPWALAIFRAAGLNKKVVYFGYNNHIWDEADGYNQIHEQNVTGTIEHWKGYQKDIFFNEATNTDSAINKLVEEINRSTPKDPLWLIAAGPLETIGMAIERADSLALKHVMLVSHSDWNNIHGKKDHQSSVTLEYLRKKGVQYKRIKDQNNQDGTPAWTAPGLRRKTEYFSFLNNHTDVRMQWLWNCRVLPQYEIPKYQKEYYDFSDAGMAYWLITGATQGGDEEASPQKVYELIKSFTQSVK